MLSSLSTFGKIKSFTLNKQVITENFLYCLSFCYLPSPSNLIHRSKSRLWQKMRIFDAL